VSPSKPSFKTMFGFKPDFPFERLLGFVFSIVMIIFLRPYITDFVPSPYYSITIDGDDFIIFTELSMWTLKS
jgi:hypothetical protein